MRKKPKKLNKKKAILNQIEEVDQQLKDEHDDLIDSIWELDDIICGVNHEPHCSIGKVKK